MKRLNRMLKQLPKCCLLTVLSLVMIGTYSSASPVKTLPPVDPIKEEVTQGALRVKIDDEVVECPLKHTDVKVDITGFIARATVTQTFHNPYDENIEAVYVFPLPHTAAVDAMTMRVGKRNIVSIMKRRAEARAVYEQAIQQGKTASLLEQERPNIFTQSVGNIKPGAEIHIEISYVDVLNYDMGTYEFHFPMVVGLRYIPGAPISKRSPGPEESQGKVGEDSERVKEVTLSPDASGTGWSPDTDRVPDASRITPPVLKPGYRIGHDISLAMSLDAGVPIQDIEIVSHTATVTRGGESEATAEISPMDAIPNKDFVMKYKVVGEKPEMAVFAHATGPEQRYFMLMIQPKLDAELPEAPPRELVFLVDTSGSMRGEPMAKVKATMRHFFRLSKPDDTMQVITFANHARQLFEKPVSVTAANIARALTVTQQIYGAGGTEMLEGIKAALNAPVDPERVRIVVMLTDGYIGNEEEIIAEVGARAGDSIRFWTIGIGSSPNRLLIDGVAKQGGGMSAVLDLNTNPKELVTRVVERIHRAQFANIQIDWKALAVYETYPRRIPELWAGSPVIVFGRYAAGGSTTIALSGTAEGKPIAYTLDVTLPDAEPAHDVLGKVWARKKIDDLSAQMSYGDTPEMVEEITRIALDYRLMSQYTSFVAVDEIDIPDLSQQAKPPRQIVVPVPLPEGVDFEGIFGQNGEEPQFFYDLFGAERLPPPRSFRGTYTGFAIGDSNRFKPNYRHEKEFTASGELFVGWTGQFPESSEYMYRPVEPSIEYMYRPVELSMNSAPSPDSPFKRRRFHYQSTVGNRLEDWAVERRASAKAAIAAAAVLQQDGHLEAARLRYQHALGLMTGIQSDADTAATAAAAIRSLRDAILKKRAETYPGLNRKLDLLLRNQSLADAIQRVVNAAGFRLDMVPGSLDDVAILLNLTACRVTYLDLRHATVVQGLEWLLAPYHLTWQMKDAKTITVGTARRMPGNAVWGYDVQDIEISLTAKLDKSASTEDATNVLSIFLQAIRTVIDQKDDSGIKPGSVVLINPALLLVYGDPEVHEKVQRFLEALKDSANDIVSIADHALSTEAREDLKALQKVTTVKAKTFAEARDKAAAAEVRQRIFADLETTSWQLLAAAVKGEIHLEALTRLQGAWAAPQLEDFVEKNWYFVVRSAWCIRTAAQVVPTHIELAAFSEQVLSKVKGMKGLEPRGDESTGAYFGTLYAVLTHRNGATYKAARALMKARDDGDLKTVSLIAEGLLSPSEDNDKTLASALSAHQIYGDDMVLLTCLIAKRRGGKLWETFWEELPDITRKNPLSGYVLVIVNRLGASRSPIYRKASND